MNLLTPKGTEVDSVIQFWPREAVCGEVAEVECVHTEFAGDVFDTVCNVDSRDDQAITNCIGKPSDWP